MSSTEVAVRNPQGQAAAIPAKLAYARELANSGLLPVAYRRNPANVLWAVEYGEMLGLPPMAAMTGVHVIEGKPTASAGLISGLVRQAGHKLRVWGNSKKATCEIVRSDDPEHVFSVTWTLRREPGDNPSAEEAGLLGKTVWKQYPASMLKSRAITQCARDACEEVLYGLHYTPEELGAEVDEDGEVVEVHGGPRDASEPEMADEARTAQAPGSDPWYVRPSPEQEWLARAVEAAPGHATLDACKEAWQTSVKHVNDGKLTRDEVTPLQNRLRARIEQMRVTPGAADAGEAQAEAEVIEGNVIGLDPEDPWAQVVADLADQAEAERSLDEITGMIINGTMDAERGYRIEAAVRARFPMAGRGEQEKAA